MTARYVWYIVSARTSRAVAEVRRSVAEELRAVGIPLTTLSIRETVPRKGTEAVAVCTYFGSRAGKTDPTCARSIGRALASGLPTIPVVTGSNRFGEVVPRALSPFNAYFLRDGLGARGLAAIILRSLGLTEPQRRVFISYRRDESSEMADQLWEALTRRGFQVFLDRISLQPGVRWHDRLFEALEEKSFVLLLESPRIRDSSAVEEEFNYARKRDMGFLVLTWPQTVAAGTLLPGVFEKHRCHISVRDISVISAQGKLSSAFVQLAVEEIETRHAAAMLRRRRLLMGSLIAELSRRGIRHAGVSTWSLLARTAGRHRSRSNHLISVTPRAPDIPDLFALDAACREPSRRSPRGVLIHTMRSMPNERVELLDWAIGRRGLQYFPDEQLVQFVENL